MGMESSQELDSIRERYARRASIPPDRYSRFNADVLASVQERQRALVSLLSQKRIRSLDSMDILEVGCGCGGNLLELIQFGASPERLAGNDLLPERLSQARRMLPIDVRLMSGDASTLALDDESFDIVYQSTVFSSILDDDLQQRVATAMWRLLRPGGAVLWYDFTYNNPANCDVRGIPMSRIRELFPGGRITSRRITLAPPIARRVVRVHPILYSFFNLLPLLRTHLLCWIEKP